MDAIREAVLPAFADVPSVRCRVHARAAGERRSPTLLSCSHDRLGTVGIVELTALVGYYTMVAMMLNAHEVAARRHDGAGRPLPALGPDGQLTVCAHGRTRSQAPGDPRA